MLLDLQFPPNLPLSHPHSSIGFLSKIIDMASLLLSNPARLPLNLSRFQKTSKSLKHSPILRSPRCSVDGGNVPKFLRVSVRDPYQRLGISPYASEEEIWGSRSFLLQQYAGNERSEESIESAFETLLMASFRQRKKTKINLKTKLKKKVEDSPPWVLSLLSFVEAPPNDVIFRRLFLFAFMGGWSIMNSAEGGPAFQMAVSLIACIFFLKEKTKKLGRACVISFGAVGVGWACSAMAAPLLLTSSLSPTWTIELVTSLEIA